MFGKVKKILGIEGVKLELIIPPKVESETGIITGFVKLTSLSDNNTIEKVHLKMIEKYTRGRKDNKLINEYLMGETTLREKISISKNDIIEIPFTLDFVFVKSEMDKLQESNFLSKGIINLAKKLRGVKSEFSVKAEATVKGTTLLPFDVKPVLLA